MFIKGNCLTTSIVLSFSHCTSLRKKCPYSELFWSAFSPHSDWMLRISQYSVRMRENAGKMRTGITPNTDTFYAVHIMKFQQGSRNSVRSLPCVRNFFFSFTSRISRAYTFIYTSFHRLRLFVFSTCFNEETFFHDRNRKITRNMSHEHGFHLSPHTAPVHTKEEKCYETFYTFKLPLGPLNLARTLADQILRFLNKYHLLRSKCLKAHSQVWNNFWELKVL